MTFIRSKSSAPSVLLVERSSESREVLATALRLRGLRIFEAAEPHRGLQLAREEHPDVIVLGFDQPELDADMQQDFAQATRSSNSGLIVLGNTPRKRRSPAERFISRPFHYGPLVQTIERMVSHAKAAYSTT